MQAILKTCIQVEERVEAIYRELARYEEADDELREIWQVLADDEARHARRIRLVADRLEMAGVHRLELEVADIQQLLERAGEILHEVQEARLSVDEAVFATVELENAFMKVHLAYGAVRGQPDLQTMFKSLAEEDRKHTRALKAYLERLGDGTGLGLGDPGQKT